MTGTAGYIKKNNLKSGNTITLSEKDSEYFIYHEKTSSKKDIPQKSKITKKMIAKDCGISEVTISKTYKKLNPFKLHLIKIIRQVSFAPAFS